MTQLYRHKWESSEGEILDAKNNYTSGFLLWCRETEGLSDVEWRRGFEVLEEELRIAERQGEKDLWPPAYPAFIEKCKSVSNQQIYKKFDETVWRVNPETGQQQLYRRIPIEDLAAKEKNYELGCETFDSILGNWD